METGMVHCKHCATPNCLDALYCKRCGTVLPEEDVKEAQARLDLLLADGRRAYEEGRTDEALAVTERILVNNPSMASAIALMTEAHARRGEIAQALESAERLVELHPDSEIDKIRRDGLRAQLAESLRPAPAPDRRFALVAGFSAVVLVACIGVLAARLAGTDRPEMVAVNDPTKIDTFETQFPTDPAPAANSGNQTPSAANKPTNPNAGLAPGDVGPIREGQASGEEIVVSSNRPLPLSTYSGNNGRLPRVGDSGGDEVVTPIQPPTGTLGGNTLPPVVTPNPVTIDPSPMPVVEEKDQGEYNIVVRRGSGPASNRIPTGGAEAPSVNGAEALMRAGTQQFQLGNYNGAAGAYEKALAAGADPLTTNQRLGMAYDNLGRKGEAASAYRRAISAGESMLASGKGNPDRVKSAIETCKAALGGS